MKKNLCALLQSLLKICLLSFIILLFPLIIIQGHTNMGYAKNPQPSKSQPSKSQSSKKKDASSDTTISTSSPASAPETSPTSGTTSSSAPETNRASIQQQPVLSSPQVNSPPTTALSINPTITANAPTATPMSTLTSLNLQKARDNGINAFLPSLALSLVAPLFIMSAGGILWLLVKWQMKRQQLVREKETQVNPWVNSSKSAFDPHEISILTSEYKSIIVNNIIRNIAEFEGSARKQSPDNAAHRKESHTHANQALSHRQ